MKNENGCMKFELFQDLKITNIFSRIAKIRRKQVLMKLWKFLRKI